MRNPDEFLNQAAELFWNPEAHARLCADRINEVWQARENRFTPRLRLSMSLLGETNSVISRWIIVTKTKNGLPIDG